MITCSPPNSQILILSFNHSGDRYVGYDFGNKKPLEDFLLHTSTTSDETNRIEPLVSTLPVQTILGLQIAVSAIYHDLYTDLVHVFTGMKFYTFNATDFKVSITQSVVCLIVYNYCIFD